MIELVALALVGMVLFTILGVGLLIAKVFFFLVFWPLKMLIRLLVGLIVLPIALVAGVLGLLVGGVALLVALIIPLTPILLIGFLIWLAVRNSRPAIPAR